MLIYVSDKILDKVYKEKLSRLLIKMCIKSAPYLHLKCANRELNMILYNAFELMLLTKFVPYITIRICCFCITFLSFDDKLDPNENLSKIAPKSYHFAPMQCRKLVQLRCWHLIEQICLVGM